MAKELHLNPKTIRYCEEEHNAAAQSSCRCIGDGTFPGPGEGKFVGKEEKAMADKVKKEPQDHEP